MSGVGETRFAAYLRPAGSMRERLQDPLEVKEGVTIWGRSPHTKVKEQLCSRRQFELYFDAATGQVRLKQLGSNPSAIDGRHIKKGALIPSTGTSTHTSSPFVCRCRCCFFFFVCVCVCVCVCMSECTLTSSFLLHLLVLLF